MSEPKNIPDPEWEEEQPLWDAMQNGDPLFIDAVSLEEFKQIADELFAEEDLPEGEESVNE